MYIGGLICPGALMLTLMLALVHEPYESRGHG